MKQYKEFHQLDENWGNMSSLPAIVRKFMLDSSKGGRDSQEFGQNARIVEMPLPIDPTKINKQVNELVKKHSESPDNEQIFLYVERAEDSYIFHKHGVKYAIWATTMITNDKYDHEKDQYNYSVKPATPNQGIGRYYGAKRARQSYNRYRDNSDRSLADFSFESATRVCLIMSDKQRQTLRQTRARARFVNDPLVNTKKANYWDDNAAVVQVSKVDRRMAMILLKPHIEQAKQAVIAAMTARVEKAFTQGTSSIVSFSSFDDFWKNISNIYVSLDSGERIERTDLTNVIRQLNKLKNIK